MNHFEADAQYVKLGEFNQSHVLRGFLTENREATPIERVESMAAPSPLGSMSTQLLPRMPKYLNPNCMRLTRQPAGNPLVGRPLNSCSGDDFKCFVPRSKWPSAVEMVAACGYTQESI